MTGLRDTEVAPETTPPGSQEGVPNYGIADDFPILWQMAQDYDYAERLGCNSNLHAEIDKAMRELWDARRYTTRSPLYDPRAAHADA